ncbi:MAG: trimethylamine methyltransferase family protein [Chloroflexi bacterium]|nr:trimethylamine methyltransferase family protein [Chloroflexota bacterium]
MALNGFARNFRPLDILTEEQVEAIHRGSLEILWVTGVRMEHERALKLLEQNGCKVDYGELRVRIPSALVEDCLRRTPSSFPALARDAQNSLMLGGNVLYFAPAPGRQTVDLDTWEPRIATRKEYYDSVTVLDALSTLHFLTTYTPYFGFEGVPPCMAMLESLAARMRNSSKFLVAGHSNDSEIFAIQMAQALGIEIMGTCTAAPPLTFYQDAIESAFRVVQAGLPVRVVGAPVMGGSAPATLAGGIVSNNAEVMAALVLAQLICPGTRVLVLDFAMPMNMNTGAPAFGDIAVCLHIAAFNQIFRRYGVPTYNADGYPGSKRPDYQCGYEKAFRALITGLSGGSSRPLHGAVYGELSHHPVQAILDDDLAGMVGRFMEGITVNDETLAIDLIEQVGPIPGHFLNREHTRKWWKHEQFVPRSADRLTYPEWINTGKKSCLDYARQRMEEILATHKPTPLTPGQEQDVERILEEARKYYEKRGMISQDEMAEYRDTMKSPGYPYE